jgi:hypothetical protein
MCGRRTKRAAGGEMVRMLGISRSQIINTTGASIELVNRSVCG